ncbi:MAG: hypothetical protein EZS28_018011 [Streblomastix strix]|uniref:Uncharacterized protein n=1 Tax=Streblomastix strix TaxID=222440 RepID=A0A5J4VVB8_9EUKA|nr:MAG: hypothetical protein EZS28_018011 [Streblomastix strix]
MDIKDEGEVTLHVSAENYTENVEFKANQYGLRVIRLIGQQEQMNKQSYSVLSNALHPEKSGLKIVGAGFHAQNFIFEYVPPKSISSGITPMITINAGSILDWYDALEYEGQNAPSYFSHSFKDCIFEGSSIDYSTQKQYGSQIGPFISIIGVHVSISNSTFTAKPEIKILKNIPSVIISAVYLFANSGISIDQCQFTNLNQSTSISDSLLEDAGQLDLAGNYKTALQRMSNLPSSLAIFAIVDEDYISIRNNTDNLYVQVKSSHFTNSVSQNTRNEAILVDGFDIIKYILHSNNQQRSKNKIINEPSNLPIITLNNNSISNSQQIQSPVIALGAGIIYGSISNNTFVINKTNSVNNPVLINFESSIRVTESGGAEQIVGEGNKYSTSVSKDDLQSDYNKTNGLFTIEGKLDPSFDDIVANKVTVSVVEDVVDESEDLDPSDTKEKETKKRTVLIIVVISTFLFTFALAVITVFVGIWLWRRNKKKPKSKWITIDEVSDDGSHKL